MATKVKVTHAIGRRKSASARVFIRAGTGLMIVNGREMKSYFGLETQRRALMKPLVLTEKTEAYDVSFLISGGGISGQLGAASVALSRALLKLVPESRPALKKEGLLSVDSRIVERKHYGHRKARRKSQFSKR